ncbi:c-type cytochrome [Aliiruegeria lutimaris]|uniref:Cytochrome c n=1 Tax=Aliiruegeria lutimaris TaxID=571298 RepID=A0A1G9HWN2_9RHOB|nr:cytochrome c family protein [Aliiruegeria lutimaris]SDL17371.1 cytochrome c [Aliiruegeria lutimaris]
MKLFGFWGAFASVGLAATAIAEGDPEKGGKVFRKCKACHAVGDDATNKTGPLLNGIVGRPAGQRPDLKYSSSLKELAEGGLTWDAATLAAFLSKPKEVVPGGSMPFAGLRKKQDIADVIACLSGFGKTADATQSSSRWRPIPRSRPFPHQEPVSSRREITSPPSRYITITKPIE